MSYSNTLTLLLGLFLVQGCDCNVRTPSNDNAPSQEKSLTSVHPSESNIGGLHKRYIVIFDISGSLKEEGAKRIATSVHSLVTQMPENSEVRIFAMDDNVNQVPVFKFTKHTPSKPKEKLQYKSVIIPQKALLAADTVLKRCKNPIQTSCIVNGFKCAFNSLNGEEPAKQTYLLVLSDMLECCGAFCPQKPKDFNLLIGNIDQYKLARYKLSSLIPLKNVWVAPITGNPTAKNNALQNSEGFDDFWTRIFKVMGYPEKPHFNQDLSAFFNYSQKDSM